MASRPRTPARSRLIVLFAVTAIVAGIAGPAGAAGPPGFKTKQAPMLTPVAPRAWVDPILTVSMDPAEMIDGYRFEAIPDGISLRKDGKGRVEVFVNHETSTVPFPYVLSGATEFNSQNDFDNSQLSRLIIDTKDATIDDASIVITSDQNFQRFCSNFLATKEHGFDRDLLLTNEEAVDWVNRTGTAWPATEGSPAARQAGVVVAYDPKTGESRAIWGLGRLNHENSLPVPGYKKPVILTGDDTFVTAPNLGAQSQMYLYTAANADAVWNDTGKLWAFVSEDPLRQGYEDFPRGDTAPISGHFIEVPKLIATGRNPDGTEVMSDDAEVALGLPAGTFAVPHDGSFSRPPGSPPTAGDIPSVDGPQWVLEKWSRMNNVFKFSRLEDMAYDKRPGMSNVIYVVDSGRGTTGATADRKSTNGRIWKMVLDKADPTQGTALSILIEGDDNEVKTPGEMHQPDNIESTRIGLYFTEDPGSAQQFNFSEAQIADGRRTEARIWQYRFADGGMSIIAKIDQSADEGPTDTDATPDPLVPPASARGNLGAWEASGIIDVSEFFGPGTFLVTVQAHTLWVEKAAGAGFTYKREGGQLLLLHVPGA